MMAESPHVGLEEGDKLIFNPEISLLTSSSTNSHNIVINVEIPAINGGDSIDYKILLKPGESEFISIDAPISNAGLDRTVNQGSQVLLNGSASSGRGNLSYKWKQTDGPQVLLTSSDSVMTSFTAPSVNSTLSFELTVQDSMGMNNTDDLSIFVRDFGNNTGNNTSNVFKAEAGPDQIVYENSTVTLDGNANGTKSGHILCLVTNRQLGVFKS